MPAVSVLIPCFNVERYLRECLDSVVNQTLRDLEIICVNDGSTDATPDILREYAARDSRILLIDKQNSGYGDSMNRALDAASGDYIGIVESDDRADPAMFETLHDLAVKFDCDLVKSNFYSLRGSASCTTAATTKTPPCTARARPSACATNTPKLNAFCSPGPNFPPSRPWPGK